MIAGETESFISQSMGLEDYDNFLFFGKRKAKSSKKIKKIRKEKKELSPEEQQVRRARRKRFWSNLESKVNSNLKEGGTVSNVLELFRGGTQQTEPQDYQINLGEQDGLSSKEDKKDKAGNKENNGNSIPTAALVVGGILILTVSYLAYQNYQSSQESKRLQS